MADNFLNISALGSGTTTANATIATVTAGSTLVAFCFIGSTSTPTLHSVSDGTPYTAGASATDAGNTIFAQVFYLQNAGSGSHTATFTSDVGTLLDIYLVEIGTTASASAVVDTKANDQVGLTTGANAITSTSLTIAAACTVAAMSCDTTSANPGDEPSVGTTPFTFTSRANAVTTNSGAGRVETAAAAANGAATFGVTSASPGNYVTLAIAVLNAPVGGFIPRLTIIGVG